MISSNVSSGIISSDSSNATCSLIFGRRKLRAIIFFSFLGGKLADITGGNYQLPFIASISLVFISLVILLFAVKDPRTYSSS